MMKKRKRITRKSTEVKIFELKQKLSTWERLIFEQKMQSKYNLKSA